MTRWLLCPWLCLAAVAGCALGPNYERPAVETPDAFRGEAAVTESLGNLPWREVFRDEALQDLILAALENNYDLRVAVTRVDQARAVAFQARADFFPQLTYNFLADRGRNSIFGQPITTTAAAGKTLNSYLVGLDASWEIDLWGRIRRSNESARAQWMASEEARRGVLVTLIGDVAQAYYELLELDLQLRIARRSTVSFAESVKLFRDRFDGGVGTRLETSRAEASLAQAAATIPDLERQILIKENQISILLGQPPGQIDRGAALLEQASLPQVPAGLPSSLLERRPDIRQAEEELRSSNALIGVAEANFFPQISLTGLFGGASTDLVKIATRKANFWSVGASLTGPLFDGGRLYGQYREAVAYWQQTDLQYRQTALTALQEVADALAAREKLQQVYTGQSQAVQSYQVAVEISRDRYLYGKATYFEVIDAQEQLFAAENALAQTRRDQFLAVVQLYKALGGGWHATEEPEESESPSGEETMTVSRPAETPAVPTRLVSAP